MNKKELQGIGSVFRFGNGITFNYTFATLQQSIIFSEKTQKVGRK